ncbi:hypothetical protein BK665_18010 [Pseudomonas frederiksbergensis]|uniref:Uncharacterized protein n=1 Tax=Pseudomonas frederiksbergensis TaxID=104087 RepID=A0A423KG29_9PSED|nr:hypothetical protein BK665_18010 [Pseudomonas frederiksbergensis]
MLGRYKTDEQYVPTGLRQRYGDRIDIRFKTTHISKGDQADYVILPGMVVRGFLSLKGDDPVFSLVMPEGDTYLHGEEHRLSMWHSLVLAAKWPCSPSWREIHRSSPSLYMMV